MIRCASCGQQNPDGFRFCGTCGAPLADATSARREERKVVTVLFCDIVGSTERAERLDPEDVRAMLGRYHEHVRHDLERYGGTVEKFIGDAAMALFGAPVAHEDDPERAVRAALAIRSWATDEGGLQVRIGITTGEALVSLGARPERGEGMAAGDVVNTAARLQAAANAGAIFVDDTTYRATRDRIEYRAVEPVIAKGKAEPVPAWEAVEARSRLGVDVGEATATPLVGRARDLDLLVQAFERTRRDGVVELITLVGEPGIGKSRLVLELFKRIEADPDMIRWRQGRSLPYGDGVALWGLGEIVKAEAGVLETDSADEAAEKVSAAVRRGIDDAADAAWVETHLRPLVGVGSDSEISGERRDEAFAAWRRFIESLAEDGPLVVVFDDLHWADDALLDFVDHLVDWAADVPILVIAVARPELLARRPNWGGGKSNATTRSLQPLTEEETTSLVHGLLGRVVLSVETQQGLVANSGGNPLYAEEFARMLVERTGVEAGSLPESVQGLIAARLDALEPEAKALLQDAAVLGKVFWLGGLAAVAGDELSRIERTLHDLERREFVRRDRAPAVAGERQFAFRHLLVRDVAYGQIPRGLRAEKHAAAARWIEGLSPDRSDDRAEMLAHHWSSALEYALAAGAPTEEYTERAVRALGDAGDRALRVQAAAAAAGLFEKALSLTGASPPPELLLRYGRSLYLVGDDRAAAALEHARGALAAADDRSGEAFAEAMLSHIAWYGGDTEESKRRSDRAVELVRDLPASEMKAHVLARAASRANVANHPKEAARLAQEAVDLAEALGMVDVRIHALTTLGDAGAALLTPGAMDDLERALELALATNSREAGRSAHNLGVRAFLAGDVARYRELHREGLRFDERFGDRAAMRFGLGAAPGPSYLVGEWDEALRAADAFIAECETAPHYMEGHARGVRAAIRFARDDVPGAMSDIERAAGGPSDPQQRAVPLAVAARIFCEIGDPRAVATALEALSFDLGTTPDPLSIAWLPLIDAPPEVRARVREAVATHDDSRSRWVAAARLALERRFVEAAELYAAMPFHQAEADARLRAAEALTADGRRAEAEAQLERALDFWRSVRATRYLRRAEALRDRIVA